MKKIIQNIVSLLAGLMFINAGLNKFFNYMPIPEDMSDHAVTMFNALMQIGWLMPLVATVEIVGGLLFIIPRTRALAATMLVPIMAGILLSHISLGEGFPIPFAMTAILIWVIVENQEKYMPMIK